MIGFRLVLAVAFFAANQAAGPLKEPFDTPLGKQYRAELEDFMVAPQQLPATCRLARDVSTSPILPIGTNPFVTDEAALIEFVSLIGFGGKRPPDVSVALGALFYDTNPGHEIGVWALRFKSPEAAARARTSMRTKGLLAKGPVVLRVWRDDEAGAACQRAIEAHLLGKGFTRLESKP